MFADLNLIAIFTTGLLTGGISCLAVQGGLLASVLSSTKAQNLQSKLVNAENVLPVLSFVVTKLVAYAILGALLGFVGSQVSVSPKAHVILQFAVVIFMIGTALSLLNVHPIFRYFVIQPPHFLLRLVRKQSKRHDLFAPVLLGSFTIFIPCGATQAMMALAIASGSPIAGAAILTAFILGTSPLFLLLGYFAMRVGDILKEKFLKVSAIFLLGFALFNLNGALALTGTPYTFTNFLHKTFCIISYCTTDVYSFPVTSQVILITPQGYSPSNFAVAAGSEVEIELYNQGAVGCQQSFTIPSLNIHKIVQPGQVEKFSFTAPDKPGAISFMCSMGMYPGRIRVI